MWNNLPNTYQEVEWLGSNWGQLIRNWLNIKPNQQTKFEFKISNWTETWDHALFGTRNLTSTNWFYLKTDSYWFNTQKTVTHWLNDWWEHIWSLSQAWLIVDWVTIDVPETTTFTTSDPIRIFSWDRDSGSEYGGSFRLHYLKIYSWDTLYHELIPCYRRIDYVMWFYDTVTTSFLTNERNWKFIKWPEVGWTSVKVINRYYKNNVLYKIRKQLNSKPYWLITGATNINIKTFAWSSYTECLEFSWDWMYVYTASNDNKWPRQWNLSSPRNINTITTNTISNIFYGSNWNWNWTPHREDDWYHFWNAYGTKCRRWTASKQRDINGSTLTYVEYNVPDIFARWRKFCKWWDMVIHQYNENISICNLSAKYDITTLDASTRTTVPAAMFTWGDLDVFINEDWRHLYAVSAALSYVYHFELATAYNFSTAVEKERYGISKISWIYLHWSSMFLKVSNNSNLREERVTQVY